MIIRDMREEDLADAAALERECFSDPWSVRSLGEMLESPHTLASAALQGGKFVGYCMVQTVMDEGEILRIAVAGRARRQGIALSLWQEIRRRTPEVVLWNLEVREGNRAAAALYEKLGFAEVGRRRNYYSHPTEDARRMQRKAEGKDA